MRTFPQHPLFADEGGSGQATLFNVLRTFDVYCKLLSEREREREKESKREREEGLRRDSGEEKEREERERKIDGESVCDVDDDGDNSEERKIEERKMFSISAKSNIRKWKKERMFIIQNEIVKCIYFRFRLKC